MNQALVSLQHLLYCAYHTGMNQALVSLQHPLYCSYLTGVNQALVSSNIRYIVLIILV